MKTVSRVRVLAGGILRGKAMGTESLIDLMDNTALKQLADAFEIIEDPSTFSHCACLGGPTLELFSANQLVARIGLHHGQSIRWSRWKHDAHLKDGSLLKRWLVEHGIDDSFLEMLLRNGYDASGKLPVGFRRSGSQPLSRAEQRVRMADLQRVHGGDIEDALSKCDAELKADPTLALGYAVRGLILIRMREDTRSIADLTQAIELGLHEAELFFSRAALYDLSGDPQQALKDCTRALEIDPGHSNAMNSRGLAHSSLGNWDKALDDFNTAIAMAPDWYLPFLNRINVHLNLNNFGAAIEDCNRVIQFASSTPGEEGIHIAAKGYWNRSQSYGRAGDFEQAENDAKEAYSRVPNFNPKMV